ncbi:MULTISPECIES: GNAT family N-acetyltransferase [Subtercola]|uniref:N-acetyltransferase n=1 Tax=Subtercola vilae TaxID=2056433 RepID=A0A4T2C0Z5_9MICO|nr:MULTISPECIES: GNAT family N-acetyltransferase [Subtercola]MEA9985146.1 GNAT family N-acetyltransferase [Subtercola sp. RTI3]TIH37657.1 N-acetyltransferase [Subtercola vilae]
MSYIVDDTRDRIDIDVVWGALREAYWGKWRSRDDVATQIRQAWRVIGAYDEQTGEQVGFARAVSDGLGFAYLADVIVLEQHRSHGLGKRIVKAMIDDGPGASFRWTLFTSNAHGLYEQFGFAAPGPTALVRPAAALPAHPTQSALLA